MASGSSFTWGSLIDPVGKTMKHYGIDPHLGIDMLVASFVLVLIAFFAGIKYRKNRNSYNLVKSINIFRTKI